MGSLTWLDNWGHLQRAGGQGRLWAVAVSLQGGDGSDEVGVVPSILHKVYTNSTEYSVTSCICSEKNVLNDEVELNSSLKSKSETQKL